MKYATGGLSEGQKALFKWPYMGRWLYQVREREGGSDMFTLERGLHTEADKREKKLINNLSV